MPVSKNNRKYTAPKNGKNVFKNKYELQTAVDAWCDNINKDDIIAKYGHITNWRFSEYIYSLENLFKNKHTFDEDLSGWNVYNITNMCNMFDGCVSFTGRGLHTWNVCNLRYANRMFNECQSLICNISEWNTKNLENASCMFYGCVNFNSDLSLWTTSKILYSIGMFYGCLNFNSDLSKWDVSNITTTRYMFYGCENFNSDLSKWDVSNITNMEHMFYNCSNFNSDLSKWDVSNITNMEHMFYCCTNFTADLNNWNIVKTENFAYMFYKSGINPYSVMLWVYKNKLVLSQLWDGWHLTIESLKLLYPLLTHNPKLIMEIAFDMNYFRELIE